MVASRALGTRPADAIVLSPARSTVGSSKTGQYDGGTLPFGGLCGTSIDGFDGSGFRGRVGGKRERACIRAVSYDWSLLLGKTVLASAP